MAADVEQRADPAVVAAHHDQGAADEIECHVVARLTDLAGERDHQWDAEEDLLHLPLELVGVAVRARRHPHRLVGLIRQLGADVLPQAHEQVVEHGHEGSPVVGWSGESVEFQADGPSRQASFEHGAHPGGARGDVSSGGSTPGVLVAHLEIPRPVHAQIEQERHEVVDGERPVAGRDPVAQTVVLVVVVVVTRRRGCGRTIAHLHADDQLRRDPGDEVEVVGATRVVPDVDAHSPVRTSGRLDDGERIGGVDDVRERQELEPDRGTVGGGPVAEFPEARRRLVEAAVDAQVHGADRLDVRHVELVDHLPEEPLEVEIVVARVTGTPPRQRLGLHHRDPGVVEEFVEPAG